MEYFRITTTTGITVDLSPQDMAIIKDHYEVQSLADYTKELYPNLEEDDVQTIAEKARIFVTDYGMDSEEAIEQAIKYYDIDIDVEM